MLEMIQSGMYIYGLAVLAAVGILSKLITAIRYGKLERQTGEVAITRDSVIRLWKTKFENTYRINKGMNDAGLFVERCLEQYKLLGVRMAVWDRINRILFGACLLLGLVAVTVEQNAGSSVSQILSHFLTTVCICGLMMFVEFFCETADKRHRLGINLEDYFTNVLSLRLQNGAETITAEPELIRAENRDPVTDIRESKVMSRREDYDRSEPRESLEKIAASREPEGESRRERKSRAKREEDVRLIEEILREYLR